MEKMEVYLDNSATTRVLPEVAELVNKIMTEDYGNPSSMHMKGVEAEKYVREAKENIARTLKCAEKNILFTSGGTESDNLALTGSARANMRKGRHIITTKIEHPAVLNTAKALSEEGFEVSYLDVDGNGVIDLDELDKLIRDDTILVSIMHTNNEIGSLQPIAEAGELIKGKNRECLFHVDAVQGYGKAHIIPRRMKIDMMSVSAHKLHGPKGAGFLYIADNVKLKPIIYGGGQQGGLRSGTDNVPGIAGMGLAAKLLYENIDGDLSRLSQLKEKLTEGLKGLEGVYINGALGAPHIVSASFEGIRSEVLLHALEEKGIYISAGSACSSHKREPSATLSAIGVRKELLESTVRFSASILTTEEEIDYTLSALSEVLDKYRKYTRK